MNLVLGDFLLIKLDFPTKELIYFLTQQKIIKSTPILSHIIEEKTILTLNLNKTLLITSTIIQVDMKSLKRFLKSNGLGWGKFHKKIKSLRNQFSPTKKNL